VVGLRKSVCRSIVQGLNQNEMLKRTKGRYIAP
jgi:hypothetical protein